MKIIQSVCKGSFISDDDVERIVNFIKAQADADYDDSFDPGDVPENEGDFSDGEAGGDPLLKKLRLWLSKPRKLALQ